MAGPYVNPLRHIVGLVAERIDQGVDFSGSGPIVAIGNGTVIETNGAGWPGGPFMSYRLDDGPLAGQVVYVAENIRPTVHAGQKVRAGQTVAQMFQGGTGIETGWADPTGHSPESQTAAAGSISGANLPGGGANPTAVGKNFDQLLVSLGVRRAPNFSNPVGGRLPANFKGPVGTQPNAPGGGGTTQITFGGAPTQFATTKSHSSASETSFWGDIWGGVEAVGGAITDPLSGIVGMFHSVSGFTNDIGVFIKMVSWLFKPSSWLRILSGVVGVFVAVVAAVMLYKAAGGDTPSAPMIMPIPV